MDKKNICDLSLNELEEFLLAEGQNKFRSRQVFSWIYHKGVLDFRQMSDLPGTLREKLDKQFCIRQLNLAKALKSSDKTKKFLFELRDGNFIEAVTISAKNRLTACISTQVGCKFRCAFCASGLGGFKRNLSCGEIINEILFLQNSSKPKKLTHIVFMGTGEPLDNYAETLKAIRLINSPHGFNIGARRITISTSGLIPGIKKLAQEGLQIELSVSLHAADNQTRNLIMPINKIYPLEKLISACREYFKETNRQITFEYILIKGLNSSLQTAALLGKILSGFDCKLNLIPANPVGELGIEPPEKKEISLFQGALLKNRIKATLRKSRGEDIDAACGQLRLKYEQK